MSLVFTLILKNKNRCEIISSEDVNIIHRSLMNFWEAYPTEQYFVLVNGFKGYSSEEYIDDPLMQYHFKEDGKTPSDIWQRALSYSSIGRHLVKQAKEKFENKIK